ncbi:hypothetical protein [Tenacibaculum ovolyticum]|uniref:hypothetical protein n=1 Tax=Tenacibaculum ovolyticum TaxID=104270 RepID=UPI0007ECC0BE|nr:hypothetical protein [Tenacibaculum ovolyticum]
MEKNIISTLLFYIIIVYLAIKKFYLKPRNKEKTDSFYKDLKKLHKFEISLEDSIKTNGFYWQESIPVDISDNKLDPKDPFLYGEALSPVLSEKFHKNKTFTNFKTKLYISIPYLDSQYKFNINLPIEETIIRMNLYTKKKMEVYVEERIDENNDICFIFFFDFTFLDDDIPLIVSHPFLKK